MSRKKADRDVTKRNKNRIQLEMEKHDVAAFWPEELRPKYEFFSYSHAYEILRYAFPEEYAELLSALRGFSISREEIVAPGGSESAIPKKFDILLYGNKWTESSITGDLVIHMHERSNRYSKELHEMAPDYEREHDILIPGFINSYHIDFFKGRIACDVEWNSKDQTFDRDLYSLRGFYESDLISVGVIITRSESLDRLFRELDVKGKFGSNSTHMGKLLIRLAQRHQGGCPILAIGIKEGCCNG